MPLNGLNFKKFSPVAPIGTADATPFWLLRFTLQTFQNFKEKTYQICHFSCFRRKIIKIFNMGSFVSSIIYAKIIKNLTLL